MRRLFTVLLSNLTLIAAAGLKAEPSLQMIACIFAEKDPPGDSARTHDSNGVLLEHTSPVFLISGTKIYDMTAIQNAWTSGYRWDYEPGNMWNYIDTESPFIFRRERKARNPYFQQTQILDLNEMTFRWITREVRYKFSCVELRSSKR